MIFRFDSSIINSSIARELASCIKLIYEKKHKIDYDNPAVWDFIEDSVLIVEYLGTIDIALIRENHEMRDVRNTDRQYFRTINVGTKSDMIDLGTLGTILNNNSCVVLENSHNDWYPIKRWVELVKNQKDYKDINRKVSEAICSKSIYPDHAGGSGGIDNKISDLKRDVYGAAVCYKVSSIFDSDKLSATDSDKHRSLKDNLKKRGIRYHEWKKREIENYIPLRVYNYSGMVNDNEEEPDTTPSLWDYTDIEGHPYFKGKYTKNKLPQLVEYIDKSSVKESFSDMSFINSVDNHQVSELQHVIFLLAKYI